MIEKMKIGQFLIKRNTRLDEINTKQNLAVFGVSNVEGITKTQHKKSDNLAKYILVKERDLAYNPYRINVGSIGLVSNGVEGLVSPAYVVFGTKQEELLPEILFTFLKSKQGLFEIKKNAKGTVRQALRFDDLCKIEMDIPEIDDQRKIVNKWKEIEKEYIGFKDVIEKQKLQIVKLRQGILKSCLLKAPKVVELCDLCDFEKGNSPIQKTRSGQYPLVTTGNERKSSTDFQFDTKAVCIPLVSSTGHGSKSLNYIHYQEGKFALGTILVALTAKKTENINMKFLHHFLFLNKDNLIVSLMKGMANVTVPIGELKKINVLLPDIKEQEKFEILMNRIDELEKNILEDEKKVDLLMQTVLQEAFDK